MSPLEADKSVADLRTLYQAVILEHNRSPRSRGRLPNETAGARGSNPLCGDDVRVSVRIDDARELIDIGFEGKSCAICTASASCMTEVVRGLHCDEVSLLCEQFEGVMRGDLAHSLLRDYELLEAFAPVSGFPSRIKCAILAWRALSQALSGAEGEVTTEGL